MRPWLRSVRRAVTQRWTMTFRAFGVEDLHSLLREVGIAPGDAVIVHSSFDRFGGFRGSLADAIRALQDAVGPEGALLMPTLPFSGAAVDFVREGKVLDLRRTPSHMGIMTEIFRRLPGVTRSLHPTHPVAGWGARAADLLGTHLTAATPCGAGSPFARLLEIDGKILLLGVGMRTMTFYHYLEEELEPSMPFSPFTAETFELSVRDTSGKTWQAKNRLYDPIVGKERDTELLIPHLKAAGVWREARVGGLTAVALRCKDVRDVTADMVSRGVFCYDNVPDLIARHRSIGARGIQSTTTVGTGAEDSGAGSSAMNASR
jgi:aminoglycoside 3-N-acetyltransferase